MVRADAKSAPRTNPLRNYMVPNNLTGEAVDLVILSENPCEVDHWKIRDTKVERAIIGGETVFQAG